MFKKVLKVSLNILGVLAFMCAIAYAILIAYGYRIDFVNRSAVKTSIIHVANKIDEVNVYLNEEEVAHKTPVEINGVLPGLNDLKIDKEGYFTWQKKLLVREDFVTKLEDVFLIAENIAELHEDIPVDFQFKVFDVSEENIFFVSTDDRAIYVYDFNEKLDFAVDQSEYDLAWDAYNIYFANHNFLIFESAALLQIVEISEDGKIKDIREVIVPDDFYGFEIAYIDGIKGVYLKDKSIYQTLIDENGQLTRIDKIFEFKKKASWFTVINQHGQNLIYLDNEVYFAKEGEFILLDQNVNDLDVSSDRDFLVYLKGDYDVMLYDFELGDTTLLEHFSDNIDGIKLNTNNKQIIFKQDNTIKICDFDFVNCFVIDEASSIDDIFALQQKSPQLLVMGDNLKMYSFEVK